MSRNINLYTDRTPRWFWDRLYYYGHFYKLGGVEIVRRLRILLGRLHDTVLKVMDAPEDPRREHLISLLRNAGIVALIPANLDPERVEAKTNEHQPPDWQVPVKALTPEGLEELYRYELNSMDPEKG